MTGPGDLSRLVFALRPDVGTYYVYFGNAQAAAPSESLEIRRGLLIEMWPYAGGSAETPDQAQEALVRAQRKAPLGRMFRDRLFFGHNPFGAQLGIVGRYSAHFLAPSDGEYDFALSSRNASFLWVNGKLIVRNGGWHGPQRRVYKRGRAKLHAGLNTLTFLHVSPWHDPVAVVAWNGGRAWELIPPRWITPVETARAGPIEQYGRTVSVDFFVEPGGETFLENRYYQRRGFRGEVTGRGGGDLVWRWGFGDGQSAEGRNVEHVFLSPGVYDVKLTVENYSRPLEITHRVAVDRDWDSVTVNRLDSVADHTDIVTEYDWAKLSPHENAEAVRLLRRAKDDAAMRKACRAFLQRPGAPAADIRYVLPVYVDVLLAGGRADQADVAVRALQRAADMSDETACAAEMRLRAGEVLLETMQAPDEAARTFDSVLREFGSQLDRSLLRRARIGRGDVWRAKGDGTRARQAYDEAGAVHKSDSLAVARGNFARRVEAYLHEKDYAAVEEALDAWEQALPVDRLEGYSTLLRVKWLLGQNRHALAARQAETLVGVNPHSRYAPELLWLAYEACRASRQPDRAKRALTRLAEDYRESPFSRGARTLLQKDQ